MFSPKSPSLRLWSIFFAATVFNVLICSLPREATAADKSLLDLKTEKVVVFKDGYCLIIKKGTAVTDGRGQVYTDQVPDAAVLGTFWAVPSDKEQLINMTAGWETSEESIKKEVPCTGTLDILAANVGKLARVELSDKTIHSGTILKLLTQETTATPSAPLLERIDLAPFASTATAISNGSTASSVQTTISGISGSHFVLRSEKNDVLLPAGGIRSLSIADMKTTIQRTVTQKTRSKRLRFRFAEAGKRRELTLIYFRPGMRWIPTYRIGLNPDKKKQTATVALQAEIMNEAEDLNDVPIDIVVGVPHFRFRTTPSPLTLERTLRNSLQQAAPQIMGQQLSNFNSLSNASYSMRSSEFRRAAANRSAVPAGGEIQLPGELTATGSQDLFVYSLPKLSLKRGERTAVSIFTAETPYRDVYTWDLHVKRNDIEAAPSGTGIASPLVLSKNQVWHQIELSNNTELPWTTGAAMVMQGNQPISQELLTYTSPGLAVRVPLTIAIEARGSFTEKEIGRELNALKWDGYNYARIEKQATLDLCNNKPIEIEAEITFRTGGKATDVSHEGKVTLGAYSADDWRQYRGRPAVNNSSTVRWKVKLKPGETFQPTVKYHYFTRH